MKDEYDKRDKNENLIRFLQLQDTLRFSIFTVVIFLFTSLPAVTGHGSLFSRFSSLISEEVNASFIISLIELCILSLP